MPAAKKPAAEKAHPATDDAGAAQVQATVDKLEEKGYMGVKVDPRPNSDYSLESGPDSPPMVDDHLSRCNQPGVTSAEEA